MAAWITLREISITVNIIYHLKTAIAFQKSYKFYTNVK